MGDWLLAWTLITASSVIPTTFRSVEVNSLVANNEPLCNAFRTALIAGKLPNGQQVVAKDQILTVSECKKITLPKIGGAQ